jgi:hypothetical protein
MSERVRNKAKEVKFARIRRFEVRQGSNDYENDGDVSSSLKDL